ncbi:periplasmic chaperone for outer membrane proteins Skp [Granulicella pectinivorans]|uniref:Periplasmic chaperone for outer membrane proteins Skp n=1 Tax=Granulicella pectinivorans TaxID=474950 RepID=A0A1I6MLD3_9BACT|nr:OmpH family outer membrane protein [Granulicella pectinivorans]SFS16536.1 periplasmic chaperone for outer membrane proteins Skp [Granulicella pectinivorans]
MRARTLLSFFALSCLATGAQQPTATPAIATISFNTAVLQTGEAQRDLGALEKKFAPRQTALKALNDEIESLRKQLSANPDKLTDTEKQLRAATLDRKEKQLQREEEDFRNDSQTEAQQVFQRVAQKVYGVLQEYARQHHYTAVIERGLETAPAVWYTAANVDITGDVIKSYDTQSSTLPSAPTSAKTPSAPK